MSHFSKPIPWPDDIEYRWVTCPQCDPDHIAPDIASSRIGREGKCLKYMLHEQKCKQCGAVLLDLGEVKR